MSQRQALSPNGWDNAMLNGKNMMDIDQAILYNLVKIRRYMTFFVVLALVPLVMVAIGLVIAVLGFVGHSASTTYP